MDSTLINFLLTNNSNWPPISEAITLIKTYTRNSTSRLMPLAGISILQDILDPEKSEALINSMNLQCFFVFLWLDNIFLSTYTKLAYFNLNWFCCVNWKEKKFVYYENCYIADLNDLISTLMDLCCVCIPLLSY